MKLQFLGATETVTGSKYFLQSKNAQILVDCGLFQGLKELRLRNWDKLPIVPAQLDAIVLTHAHLDHCGYFPLLVKNGFKGKLYCTFGTKDLAMVILRDSGRLQEEEAEFRNRHKRSKHQPALALYTESDVERCLRQIVTVEFGSEFLIQDLKCRFFPAGHILGAAMVHIRGDRSSVLFSGDLGRPSDIIMKPPHAPVDANCIVIESTYGNRLHPPIDPTVELETVLARGIKRGAVILIPAFSVGRTQSLLHVIEKLFSANRIPRVPVFLNSPMSVAATEIYTKHHGEHRLSVKDCERLDDMTTQVNNVIESKFLNMRHGPMIIVSASGMLTGGRILHHLIAFAPDANNMIVLTGFQAAGTRGAALAMGRREIKIFGEPLKISAEVVDLQSFSAHADQNELMDWLRSAKKKPKKIFVTHGEPAASEALAQKISDSLEIEAVVPRYLETHEI